MSRNDLRDKLDGDTLDLSMMKLTEVPIKEIAALPKATKVDLSNNELVSLPPTFASTLATQIVHLDLSTNKLCELPTNISNLRNLKHLDLYNNQLTELPVSLCQLKNLRWLDVKGNPLQKELKKAAGDCLNQKECEAAAKNVIAYLKTQQSQQEREKQQKLKEQKELELAKLREEEIERMKKKEEKVAAKEKRKAESNKVKAEAQQKNSESTLPKVASQEIKKSNVNVEVRVKGGISCLGWLNFFLVIVLTMSAGICISIYSDGDFSTLGLTTRALPRLANRTQAVVDALWPHNLRSTGEAVASRLSVWCGHRMGYLETYTGDLSIYTEPMGAYITLWWGHTCDVVGNGYLWVTREVNWKGVQTGWDYVQEKGKVGWHFAKAQCQVLGEELSKNEALMSLVESARAYVGSGWVWAGHAAEWLGHEGWIVWGTMRETTERWVVAAKEGVAAMVK